jgi:hypothetical protein
MRVICILPYKAFINVYGWSAMTVETLTRESLFMAMEALCKSKRGLKEYRSQPH